MTFLSIKTDSPTAEIGLYEDDKQLTSIVWQAHRQLAETIHSKIFQALTEQNLEPSDIEGVVAYEGPGSFTGLRIGLSVANAYAYSYSIPVVASGGESWIEDGLKNLTTKGLENYVLPKYGSAVNITKQRK